MKAHRSLYTKIVLWFFLNLVLLAAVAYSFYELRFRLNPESPLLGQPAHQLRAVGRLISGELASTPRADWGDSLGRFAEAYGLDFLVVNDRGERVAGRSMSLPLEVREKLTPRQPRPTPTIPPTQPPMTGHPLKGLSGITNNNTRPESTLPPASIPQINQPVFLAEYGSYAWVSCRIGSENSGCCIRRPVVDGDYLERCVSLTQDTLYGLSKRFLCVVDGKDKRNCWIQIDALG